MRLTFDNEADAVYIQLRDDFEKVAHTYGCDPDTGKMINLDFDRNMGLIGIEIMDASKLLPPEFLVLCEKIG